MGQKIKLWKNSIRDIIKCIGLVLCFMIMEMVFRIQPEIGVRYVLVTDKVPVLFDFFYGIIVANIHQIHYLFLVKYL